jgi:Mg2+-importing ATPase
MIVFGLISSVFDLLTFAVLLLVFRANEATFQTSWFMISLLTELAVVLVLRTHRPAFRSRPSRLLLWSTLAVAAATFTIPFLGSPSAAFGFVPLSALQLGTVIAIVVGYIVATEVGKAWFFRTENTLQLPADPPAT